MNQAQVEMLVAMKLLSSKNLHCSGPTSLFCFVLSVESGAEYIVLCRESEHNFICTSLEVCHFCLFLHNILPPGKRGVHEEVNSLNFFYIFGEICVGCSP